MTDFTLTNLADVEDMAAKHGMGAVGSARFARGAIGATQTGVVLHTMNPGMRQGFGHAHGEAEEIHVVLTGSGRAKLDDELIELRERDILRIAPHVKRRFEAGPEGLELLVFGQHFDGDGEMLPEFWATDDE